MNYNQIHRLATSQFLESEKNYITNQYNTLIKDGCCGSATFNWLIGPLENLSDMHQFHLIYFYHFISDLVFPKCLTAIPKSDLGTSPKKAILVKTFFLENEYDSVIKFHIRGFKISSNSSESDTYELFDMNKLYRPQLRSYSEIADQFSSNNLHFNEKWPIISHRYFQFQDLTDPSIKNVISYAKSFLGKLDFIKDHSSKVKDFSIKSIISYAKNFFKKLNSNEANSMRDSYAIALYMYFKIAFKNQNNLTNLSFKETLGLKKLEKSKRLKFFSTIFDIRVSEYLKKVDSSKLGELINENINTNLLLYSTEKLEISFKNENKYVPMKEFVNNFYSDMFKTPTSITSSKELNKRFTSFGNNKYNLKLNCWPILNNNTKWALWALLVTVIGCGTYYGKNFVSLSNIKPNYLLNAIIRS